MDDDGDDDDDDGEVERTGRVPAETMGTAAVRREAINRLGGWYLTDRSGEDGIGG